MQNTITNHNSQLTVNLLFHLELGCQLMTTLVQCHLQLPLSGIEGIVVGIGGSGGSGGDATTCCNVQQGRRDTTVELDTT